MKYLKRFTTIVTPILLAITCAASAAEWDIKSDTWVYTDALGRKSPVYVDCPSTRSGKLVGMFYFLWHGQHDTQELYDITKLLAANPANPEYGKEGSFHWWGEPEAGYFRGEDPWVIRRNISMICDAGVDVVIFDVTNGYTYPEVYIPFCQIATLMKSQGCRVPKIAFITRTGSADISNKLYNDFYSKYLYSDLWFRWQGKPMMFGYQNEKHTDGTALSQAVKDFFTWREAWAWESGQHRWQWLDLSPQRYGWDTDSTIPEEIPVGVASHPVNNIGRSCTNNVEPQRDINGLCPTTDQGLYFNEQWQRALQVDPAFVWVTGWNEWVAQRFINKEPAQYNMGKLAGLGATMFIDCYNREYSRDIEPMKGGYTDNYYYQLASNIRKYKGVRKPEVPSAFKTIKIDGKLSDWANVGPEYRDTIGDVIHRDHDGWGDLHYKNTTGRNDIVKCKVARDSKNVYFCVETVNALSKCTSPNWMLIFIDSDFNPYTGWNGYDYVINHSVSREKTTIKRNTGGWNWKLVDNIPYRVSANKKAIEISVPKSCLGFGAKVDPAFDFHIADNIGSTGEITEFALNGDSAPNRRANYRYSSYVPGPVWEFSMAGNLEGWNATHDATKLTVSEGCIVGDVSGSDHIITSERYPSIDASANHYIQIRMKCTAGNVAEFFWSTADQPGVAAERKVAFKIIPDGQFHNYTVNMSSNAKWKGWVNTLRFNPTTASGGRFVIDYIRLRKIPQGW